MHSLFNYIYVSLRLDEMIYQLTYISEPFPWITIEDINNILMTSQAFNSANNITGCLIYTKRTFMQLLEGEKKLIDQLYQRIEKDKRHFNVQLVHTTDADKRIFPSWAMAYLGLQESTSAENINEIQQKLVLLSEGASVSEINLHQFWNQVYEVLKEFGYYPDPHERP